MAPFGGVSRSGVLRIALLVSLGINLFLAGSWVGSLVRSDGAPPPRPRPLHAAVQELRGRISTDSFDKIEALVGEIDGRFRASPADPRRMDERLRVLLGAETFDPAAFATTVDTFLAARSETDKAIARRIGEVLAGVPVSDRKVIAEVVLRGPGRPFGPPPGPPPGPLPGPPPR